MCGAEVPTDSTVDGRDISALWFDESGVSPHEAFYFYWMNDLEADIGETTDVSKHHPEMIVRLNALAEAARRSLGDKRLGRSGNDVRPVGRVDSPQPLTTYDPEHPYFMAEYDLPDRG